MENRSVFSPKVVAGLIAALCVLVCASNAVRAQQARPSGPPPPGSGGPFAEIRERQQREAQLRSAEMLGTVKNKDQRAASAAAEQLRDDFRNIQLMRNKIVRYLQSDAPLDYKLIARETGEISKRAGRLKSHLLHQTPDGERKEPEPSVEIVDAQMKDALVTMCKRIDSFTESPVFKVPAVVNIEQSAKANRDLRLIVLLSGGIHKTAERLSKPDKK